MDYHWIYSKGKTIRYSPVLRIMQQLIPDNDVWRTIDDTGKIR